MRCPGRNTTSSFAPYLIALSERCDPATRLKSADSEASTRAKDERASDAIQEPEPASKCHRRKFLSSNRARKFAKWLIESEQDSHSLCGLSPRPRASRANGQAKTRYHNEDGQKRPPSKTHRLFPSRPSRLFRLASGAPSGLRPHPSWARRTSHSPPG